MSSQNEICDTSGAEAASHEQAPYRLALFPQERHLAALTKDGLHLIDRAIGSRVTLRLKGNYGDTLDVSPDGATLVIGGDAPKRVDFLAGSLV